MALWKPFRGTSAALANIPKTDGYVYFCTDDGSLFFDYKDENNELQRKQVNEADIAALKSLIGTLPDTTKAQTIIAYIDEVLAGARVDLTTLADSSSTMSTRAGTYGLARSADITYTELQVGQSISRVKFDITKSNQEMDAWLNSLVFPAGDNILVLAADAAEGSIISAQIMDAAGTKALCFGGDGIAYATNDIAEAGISHGWIVGQFAGFDALDENGVGLLLDQHNETPCQIGTINPDVSGWNGVFVTAGLNENAGSGSTQYGTIESGTNIDSLQFDTGFDIETFLRAQDYSAASAIPLIEATANGETATLLRVFHDVSNTENPDLYELLITETTVYSSQSGWQRLDGNNAVHLPTLLSEYGLNVTSVYINSVYTVNGEEWNGTLVKARVGDSNSESGGGNTEASNSITPTDAGFEVNYTNGRVLLPFRFGNVATYIENNKINVDVINDYDILGNLPIVNTNLRDQYFYPETHRYYRHTGETGTKDVSNSLNIGEAINSIKFNTGYNIDNFVRSIPYDGSGTCNLLYVGADAPAAMETGVSVTKFKFYRDYGQLDTFLSGLDYSGLADGEPFMLVRVDNGNYEIAAFKIGTAYMLGYMESGSGIIVYSTAEVTEHNVVQGWQNLNDDNLINASGNITAVYTNNTSWIGNIVDAISYQSKPFLIALYNSNDGSYSFGSMLEDRIWDTTSGWQNLDENGVYNFSAKLQAVLGVNEVPITEIADHNGWNGNLAMKNQQVSTDSTVFINGVIYFYDGSSYKAVNGESDRQEILDVSHGGTGVASFNNNNSLVLTGDSATSNLTTLTNGPEGYVLQSNGPGAIPSWIPSTEISSKSVYVLNVSGEGSVTALQARSAIDAFNNGKSVICRMNNGNSGISQMTEFLRATLTSVVYSEASTTSNTVMTFLADIGDTVIKFTLDLPSNAADSDELTFNQTEFGGTDITIATASDIDTIIL